MKKSYFLFVVIYKQMYATLRKTPKRGQHAPVGFFVHLSLLHAQGTWRTAGARYNNGSLANRKRQIAYAPNHTLAHFSALSISPAALDTIYSVTHIWA